MVDQADPTELSQFEKTHSEAVLGEAGQKTSKATPPPPDPSADGRFCGIVGKTDPRVVGNVSQNTTPTQVATGGHNIYGLTKSEFCVLTALGCLLRAGKFPAMDYAAMQEIQDAWSGMPC